MLTYFNAILFVVFHYLLSDS